MATKAAPPSEAEALATSGGLQAPRPAPGVVDRPRMFALLDHGTSGPVTLVSAPAGSGKTMLAVRVVQWLAGADPAAHARLVGVTDLDEAEVDGWRRACEAMFVRATGSSGSCSAGCATTTARSAPARLPDGWQRLRFRVAIRGQRVEVDMRREATTYRLLEGRGLLVAHDDELLALRPGAPVSRAAAAGDDELPLAA
jgi:hypothetical protein